MPELARYLYAVTRPVPDDDALTEIRGIAGAPVDSVRDSSLVAVVSHVELREFGEQALRANLEKLDWLEDVARAHHSVVQAVSLLGPTAPLRLGTICLDDEGVHSRLTEWHTELERVLTRVDGRSEWSVKVLTRPSHTRREPVAPVGAAAAPPSGGAAYLRRKKAEAQAAHTVAETSARTIETVRAVLGEESVDEHLFRPQDPALSGRQGTMLLNAAYLVPADRGSDFQQRVDALREQHPEVRIDCEGPWPPYAFAMLDSDD